MILIEIKNSQNLSIIKGKAHKKDKDIMSLANKKTTYYWIILKNKVDCIIVLIKNWNLNQIRLKNIQFLIRVPFHQIEKLKLKVRNIMKDNY